VTRLSRVVAVLAALITTPAWAADPRLVARLDGATLAEVQPLLDNAEARGLPTAPLVSKALEGAAKGAPRERIVAAVRSQVAAMAEARAALGDTSSASEIAAGAGALMVGVPRDSLERLRSLRPGQALVVPLVVLADLVARRVPAERAAEAVLTASRSRARDADLLKLRQRIESDIAAGAAPGEAAILRARDFRPAPGASRDGNRPRVRGEGGR
jgi:hypothetical protein